MNETPRTEEQLAAEIKDVRSQLAAVSEHGSEAERHRDRLIALTNERLALQQAAQASRVVDVGTYRIPQPEPAAAPSAPAPMKIDLPGEVFAGFERDVAHAQTVAEREGITNVLPSVLVMMGNIPRSECTPTGADEKTRIEAAERTMAALTRRYGVDRANEIADAANAMIRDFGLARFVDARGLGNHVDLIEHVGRVALNRRPRRA